MIIMRKLTEMSQEERTNELNYWVAEKRFYVNCVKLYKEALDCLKNLDNDYFEYITHYSHNIGYIDGDWVVFHLDSTKEWLNEPRVCLNEEHTSSKETAIERLELIIECAEHTADYSNEKINEIMYIEREYIDL